MTGEDLRQTFSRLSDSEFKALMQTLDPGGTGLVSASALVQLLQDNREVSL